MANTPDLAWQTIDTTNLPDDLALAYEDYRDLNRKAQAAREAFETAFRTLVPAAPRKSWLFGYRFGKLSVALGDAQPIKSTAPRGALTLDMLRKMQGIG